MPRITNLGYFTKGRKTAELRAGTDVCDVGLGGLREGCRCPCSPNGTPQHQQPLSQGDTTGWHHCPLRPPGQGESNSSSEDLSSCTSRREQEHRLSNLHRGLAQCGTASPHQRQKVQSLAAKDPPPPPLAGKTNGGSGSLPAPPRSGTGDDLPDRASILGMVPSARVIYKGHVCRGSYIKRKYATRWVGR